MTTQVSKKVRLVRCPGCRNVLAELPEVSLYKCGGCGTILQAKSRKPETNNTELSSQETDSAVAESHQDNVLGQDDARSSNQDEKDGPKGIFIERSASDELSSSADVASPPVKVKESPESNGEQSVGPTSSDELPSSGEITLENESQNQNDLHQGNRVDQKEDEIRDSSEHEDRECVLPERIKDNYSPSENDEKIQSCSADQEGEFNGDSGELVHENDATPLSAEQVDVGFEGIPISRSLRREKNESLVSFYLSSDGETLDHSQSEGPRTYGRLSSIDTLGSSHLADLDFRHESLSNHPINGGYYAYDGSESSYDGTDDPIFEQHLSRKNYMLRKERDNVVKSEPERTYRATGSSHRAMRSSHLPQGTTTDANMYNSGRRMRVGEQGEDSGLPFASRDSVTGHRIVRPPGYRHNSLPPRPGVNLPNKPSYSEPDKLELLRTVYELKDQLNKMHFAPFHHHAEGCAKRCDVSRLAFSGEAAHYRHHVSCSCLHCCPRDWHYSAQLPPHNCCSVSNSPSPHNYTSSEISLWGCDTKPDNQMVDERKRLHLREKYHTARRHLRPVAGGAPVVACYECSELLQLPADFLLFKRRYHRLMCNACKKVLKFSVLRGTHIVPYVNDASAPPPSEADDYNDTPRERNLGPVSYSDDYGQSFCRSCSTEASVMLPSSDRVETKSCDRKMKGVMKEPQSENEGTPGSVGVVGPSSRMPRWTKVTSEIEEVAPPTNSPLHRLMGYRSPSQVLNR